MKINPIKFLLIVFVSTSAFAKSADLFDMADQFDAMDKQDFQGFIEKANSCTRTRNFSCTESELAKANKLANSAADKKILLASQTALKNEKNRMEQERLEGIRREEEAERKRIAMEEQARRREEQRQRAEEEAQESRTNTHALLAIAGAAVIGSAAKNYSDSARSAMVDAWVKDQMNASNGVTTNNFEATTDAAITEKRMQTELQIREQREQRERDRLEKERQQELERQRQAQLQRELEAKRLAAEQERLRLAQASKSNQTANNFKNVPSNYQGPILEIPEPKPCPPGYRWRLGTGADTPGVCYKDPQFSASQNSGNSQTNSNGQQSNTNNPNSNGTSGNGSAGNTAYYGSNGNNGNSNSPSNGNSGNSNKGGSNQSNTNKGEKLLEALAICRQSTKNQQWRCIGPLQDTILYDGTLESNLESVKCAEAEHVAETATAEGQSWDVYRCGYGLEKGDINVKKKYGLITIQRTYQCSNFYTRCKTLYTDN